MPIHGVASRRPLLLALLVTLAAYFLRLPLAGQSLWYDEMFTWHFYVRYGPLWISGLGAPPPSEPGIPRYLPNNHILYSLLAWASTAISGMTEQTFRLPSVLAGALFGAALAWPLLHCPPDVSAPIADTSAPAPRPRMILALLIVLVGSFHPWLLAFSTEARGYALLLLLCVVATHCLPKRAAWITWPYVAATAAAIYTVPLGIAAVIGHGVAQLTLRGRGPFFAWLRSAAAAGGIVLLLYSPLLGGMRRYFASATTATNPPGIFLEQVFEHTLAGRPIHQPLAAIAAAALILVGGAIAYRRDVLRPTLITFAVASVIALLLPLVLRGAGEPRFALWPIPLSVIALSTLLAIPFSPRDTAPQRARRPHPAFTAVPFALAVLLLIPPYIGLLKYPAQPCREALEQAQDLAPTDARLAAVGLAAREALYTYPTPRPFDIIRSAHDLADLESSNLTARVWLVIFFPQFLDHDQPELSAYIRTHYTVAATLPARWEPVQILHLRAR